LLDDLLYLTIAFYLQSLSAFHAPLPDLFPSLVRLYILPEHLSRKLAPLNESDNNQLNLLKDRFQAAYNHTLHLNGEFVPFFDKWYLMYLIAIEERRMFFQIYKNLRDLNFSDIIEKA
jgi:hypothetical protein